MKRKNVRFDKDIRPFDTVCWLPINYEDLQDIKQNSMLAVKVATASSEYQTARREQYVWAAQNDTENTYIEVDDAATVTTDEPESGAYVQGWIWVDVSALEKPDEPKNYAGRQKFVNNALLSSSKKKVTRGKKESSEKGNRKGKAKSKGKSSKAKAKNKG